MPSPGKWTIAKTKSGPRCAGTEEGSVPLTDPLPGPPNLHRERTRKESERGKSELPHVCRAGRREETLAHQPVVGSTLVKSRFKVCPPFCSLRIGKALQMERFMLAQLAQFLAFEEL